MDSLSLLMPADLDSSTPKQKSRTQIYLENLNEHFIDLLNKRDYSNPDFNVHLAHDINAYMERSKHSATHHVTSREAFLNRYKAIAKDHPNYSNEVKSQDSVVDEDLGHATTWCLMTIRGHPEGIEREGIVIGRWQKRDGVWVYARQDGIRNMGGAGL